LASFIRPSRRKRLDSSRKNGRVIKELPSKGNKIATLIPKIILFLLYKSAMIFIAKGKKVALPREFRPINNTTAYIYNQLVELIKGDLYSTLRISTVTPAEAHNETIKGKLKDANILDWLKKNTPSHEFEDVLTKSIASAIVADMANFVYEAISAAQRGKLSVGYALLRKPFTDELLILEQLLVDRTNFINNFYSNTDPSKYNPLKLSKVYEDVRLMLEKSLEKVATSLFTLDTLYSLRYDGSSPVGILGYSQRALHIVTNGKGYETNIQNLNFVFSNAEDFDKQWKHFYFVVPYLLIYTLEVVDAIFLPYLESEPQKSAFQVRKFRRLLAMVQWLVQSNWEKTKERTKLSNHIKK
jgi:hypothetical protein